MMTSKQSIYIEHVAQFYTQEYGFTPIAGRLLGYLSVCSPARQPINEVAETLMASRTAIIEAVKILEGYRLVRRTRHAGERSDHIVLDTSNVESTGFKAIAYAKQAALAREALSLLDDSSIERRTALEDMADLAGFMAEHMPKLLEEWRATRGRA